jgi:hypothetical protein
MIPPPPLVAAPSLRKQSHRSPASWCALKKNPHVGCQALEDRSGNDRSPHSLKAELETILREPASRERLLVLVRDRVDVDRINMPSFTVFRERLEEVI